jgi:hypothetical protein
LKEVRIAGHKVSPGDEEMARAMGLLEEDRWKDEPGILSGRGRVIILLPRFYHRRYRRLPPRGREAERAAWLLVSVLSRYARGGAKTSVQRRAIEVRSDHPSQTAWSFADPIEAGLLIARDYRRNGPLPIAERNFTPFGRGRIDWKRSLRKGHPVSSEDGLVFDRHVQDRVAVSPSHEFTELHRNTAMWVATRFGFDTMGPGGRSLHSDQELDPAAARDILARNRHKLFADRHRHMLEQLERFYEDEGLAYAEGETSEFTGLVATNFPLVWETMLQSVLQSEQWDETGYRSIYCPLTGGGHRKGLDLRPDIVLREGSRQVIADAKDYREGSEPQGKALRKQLLYRLLLTSAFRPDGHDAARTGNCFLFPATTTPNTVTSDQKNEFELKGFCTRSVHHFDFATKHNVGRIASMEVDYERIAQAYTAGRIDFDLRSDLIERVMEWMTGPAPCEKNPMGART